ncbi:PAS domain-containing protein [Planctobacterium marinum]|uniref:PAS domain S-box protein n=1 Tax=Planctobacterium marinum TaxID=1631968 RepID=A0AA48HT17_9ALTE|nr:hypothetical protein MACH26_37080 [Planctobacterium marinum]
METEVLANIHKEAGFDVFRNLAGDSLGRVLELFVLNTFDSLLITTPEVQDHKILYANPVFCKMTGYELDELLGKRPSILSGEKTSPEVIERLKHNLRNGEPFYGATVNYRKDGSEYYVEWNIHHVRDDNGKTLFFVSIQKDLTKLKTTLDRLKHRSENFKSFLTELVEYESDEMDIAELATQKRASEEKQLKSDARLFTKGLRSEAREAQFGDEFFDFDLDEPGVLVSTSSSAKLSAQQFLTQTTTRQTDINTLGECIDDLLNFCEIAKSKDEDLIDAVDLFTEFQAIGNTLFYIEEFTELGTTISELHLKYSADEGLLPSALLPVVEGIGKDLKNWYNGIFIEQEVEDIHWLDPSLVGSCRQLLTMLA